MDRTQALRLWLGTLEQGLVGGDAETRGRLEGLWAGCGLDAAEAAAVRASLDAPDELARRERLVRATRGCIRRAGHDPDLLSTPAAGMRGL
jgi:hypothetical protein